MATSFTPKVYEIMDKNGPGRVFTAASKVWNVGPLLVVDQAGALSADQIYVALENFVHARQRPTSSSGVVEITATTV
jgi:hypothetical protein